MDKSQHLLEKEIAQLRPRIESEPETVLTIANQCAAHATQILYPEGMIQSLIIMSRCYWAMMDYRKGLKCIKEANSKLTLLDNDDLLPEILHLHALHYWGQAKYYSAQQYWISALEQSALVEETCIQIEALIGLGNVWRITHEYHLAKSTHELSVIVANHHRIKWLEGKARILLAWDHYLLHDYVDMLSILDGALEALNGHDNKTWEAEIWDFRGLALLGLERIDDAEVAISKAYELAERHNLTWMKAQSYISRARLELLRKCPLKASELLTHAEKSASNFDNGELLTQICFQQSRVAEEIDDYEIALHAFKKYRQHSAEILREQTARESNDRARASKRQLEQRANKLINRIRAQHEYDPEDHMSQMVSETYWWEQLILHKTELNESHHSIVVIQHSDPAYLDISLQLAHALCTPFDLLTRLSADRLGMIIAVKGDEAKKIFNVLSTILDIYPWQRQGLTQDKPKLIFQDVLAFPFTLEQLEEEQVAEV